MVLKGLKGRDGAEGVKQNPFNGAFRPESGWVDGRIGQAFVSSFQYRL